MERKGIIGWVNPYKKGGPPSGPEKRDGEQPNDGNVLMNRFLRMSPSMRFRLTTKMPDGRRTERCPVQERIQARIKKFAWTDVPEEQTGFLNTLSQFFSPWMIVDGLTKGEARLLHLIAMHFQGRAMSGIYHPKEWRYKKGKRITREQFMTGLAKFMRSMIATGGLVSEKKVRTYPNIGLMFSPRDWATVERVIEGKYFYQLIEFINTGLKH